MNVIQSQAEGPTIAVAVAMDSPELGARASALAERLGLSLAPLDVLDHSFLLVVTENGLELRETGTRSGPLRVDFAAGALAYRRHQGGGRREPLARAVGFKGAEVPTVLDATAGMGRDAFILASLGCRVRLAERSPVMAALLADALDRAREVPELSEIVNRMTLLTGNAATASFYREIPRPEVITLDPMYPHRTKSALVKKEMRMLRALVGDDPDADRLLETALAAASRRVVVKRPKGAPPLAGREPSHSIREGTHRFDVYLNSRQPSPPPPESAPAVPPAVSPARGRRGSGP